MSETGLICDSCGCPKMRSCALTRHDALASWGPMCRVLYRLLVSLARLAVRSGRSKDLEIIVLRHQLAVPAPAEPPASARRRGPGPAGCRRSGGAPTAAMSWLARHTRDFVALASTPNRPPLDPTLQGARAALHLCGASPPHHRDGHQQPDMGLPPYHRRTRRPRSPRWSLHCVENPNTARHRPRPAAHERYLVDSVPALPGRGCL